MFVAVAAGVVALVSVACVLARAANRKREQRVAREQIAHPRDKGGIFVGAEPLQLDGGNDRGLLLLHGFNDTPQSVEQLARALHAGGWTVHVPLLPHHGRGGDELADHGSAADWVMEARRQWELLRSRVARPVLCGQSMGGALAVIVANESPPEALVLLAPYLSMGWLTRELALIWPLWQLATPKLFTDPRRGLHDPGARARALGNWWFTPRLVRQLMLIVADARRALPSVRAPTLVLHARADYRIPSPAAVRAFDRLGAADKTIAWSERGGHVLAADEDRDAVIATVSDWLDSKVRPR